MEALRYSFRKTVPSRRIGFTLVELLVVITIIGILVSLITVAAIAALRAARQAALKFEIDQISGSIEKLKDSTNGYPPNLMIDDNDPLATPEVAAAPIIESEVLSDLRRYMLQAFPRHKESDNLLRALVGAAATGADASDYPVRLAGGLSAAEAIVFWLGGFGTDSQYPISGEGGPAYPIPSIGHPSNRTLDPIESRKWVHELEVAKLGPREDSDGYFASTGSQGGDRFIEYTARLNGSAKLCRINFWTYKPGRSALPVLYFDVSRHPVGVVSGSVLLGTYDPPAASDLTGNALHVHAFKMRSQSASATVPIQFANQGKFQILHGGIDDDWGFEIFEKMSVHDIGTTNAGDYLLFPTGPFTEAAADTVVNFATQPRIEDAQQ